MEFGAIMQAKSSFADVDSKSYRAFQIALLSIGLVALLARLIINLMWQLPAPIEDSALFASVSINKCVHGIYGTPTFPLDPTGADRYIWHGIVSPALVSFLMPSCDVLGLFAAQTAIMVLTFLFVTYATFKGCRNIFTALIVGVIAAALQAKIQFRPEAVAIFLYVLAEFVRKNGFMALWGVTACAIAWTQPTAAIIYGTYALLSVKKSELTLIWRNILIFIALIAIFNLVAVYLYPFPIRDLLDGLAVQGQNFVDREDGTVFQYFIRSDFFPLFGFALLLSFGLRCVERPALILLIPLLWFYALRVPPAYYNCAPLLVMSIYLGAIRPLTQSADLRLTRISKASILVVGALAACGLWQGVARDLNSKMAYGVGPAKALEVAISIEKSGKKICGMPAFFPLLMPGRQFASSFDPKFSLANCEAGPDQDVIDLVQSSSADKQRVEKCFYPFESSSSSFLGKIFRSDSGYSFYLCHR